MNVVRLLPLATLALVLANAEERAVVHPTVFMTPADIQRGRDNARRPGWGRSVADAIVRQADPWLKKDDAWLLRAVPPAGAAFAYGFTGCPICSASWGTWGSAHASFDHPGEVVCTRGHRLPDKDHPDPGTGYVGPDKRIHYFVGSYNAWAVETLTFKAIDSLTYAYALTGDERYASKAVLILDALATIYPLCDKGSWDYPSNPPSGRFDRPWYQVARVLVHYVDYYDQLYKSPALDTPSVRGGSKRANIEENLLKNGAEYCYKESLKGRLSNGEADYIRGALAVGAVLDIPAYVKWAVEGPYGIYSLLENNVDRDGGYDETSSMYANHTRGLYFSFAEPLVNYRGAAYPQGINLYENPKLRQFLFLHNLRLNCAGHVSAYGDSGPDAVKRAAPARPFDRDDYEFLERLYARTTGAKEERELAATLAWLANGKPESLRASDKPGSDSTTASYWLLFHAKELPDRPPALSAEVERSLLGSHFLGQKGIAVLRTGREADAQALLFRFGPSLIHGHLDDLNVNYYARGYELTYDLGYGVGSTHTQTGWSHQTASHNLVTVNERSQLRAGGSGGSLWLFADLPALKVVEASSEASYASEHVSLYRRTLALIGDGPGAYLLDIFRVRGGRQHDYGFHAPAVEAGFDGVSMGGEDPGSLAGPEIAWGDRQLNDGYLSGVAQTPYWVAPPGNGFGFLVHPQRGKAGGAWSADWRIDDSTHVRLTMPAAGGEEVITAIAPGILPSQPKARYVFARRRGEDLASQFVATIEPHGGTPQIARVERLPLAGPPSDIPPVAVKIERRDGAVDYVFSSADALPRTADGITFAGRFAYARVSGKKIARLSLVGAREFSGFGVKVKPPADGWRGVASEVDRVHNAIVTSARLPLDGSLDGEPIVFSNPDYSRTTAYRIRRVEAAGTARRIVLEQSVTLGRGQIGRIVDAHTLTSIVPHEYAVSVAHSGDSGFFKGKRIRSATGATAAVTGMKPGPELTIMVNDSSGFKPGDVFSYEDLQRGDGFEILSRFTRVYSAMR